MQPGLRPWVAMIAVGLGLACESRSSAPPEAASQPPASMAPAADEHTKDLRAAFAPPQVAAAQGGDKGRSGAPGATEQSDALAALVASRKLIRTGQMSIEVASYDRAAEEIGRLAESLGGYVADTRSSRLANGKQRGSVTVRVPAERFGQAVSGAQGLGTVRSQTISAQDVTKAYADLETRLAVKRDTADRLRDILRTRTARLSDILEAERELARVTGEIEQMEGERRFYDQQVALSTLSLDLFEPEAIVRSGSFGPIAKALGEALEVLSSSVAVIVYLTVAVLPWLVAAWMVWLLVRFLRRRKGAAPRGPES